MSLTNEQVKDLITSLKQDGYDVGLRDISFVVLSRFFADEATSYRVIFGDGADLPVEMYGASDKVAAIREYLEEQMGDSGNDLPVKSDEGLSFDEIKKGLIEDMNALIALRDSTNEDGSSPLDAKEMATVVGRIADIRAKLVDKFGTTEKSEEQRVVVVQKYNSVCPYCRHEISIK